MRFVELQSLAYNESDAFVWRSSVFLLFYSCRICTKFYDDVKNGSTVLFLVDRLNRVRLYRLCTNRSFTVRGTGGGLELRCKTLWGRCTDHHGQNDRSMIDRFFSCVGAHSQCDYCVLQWGVVADRTTDSTGAWYWLPLPMYRARDWQISYMFNSAVGVDCSWIWWTTIP